MKFDKKQEGCRNILHSFLKGRFIKNILFFNKFSSIGSIIGINNIHKINS